MSRVLLFATTTGYQTRAFAEAADALGVDLVLATDRCHVLEDPWQDRALPIRFQDEEGSTASIVGAAALNRVDGVLAVGDRPTIIAARVAAALGLPWHTAAGTSAARHKRLTRERLQAAGLPVPWFAQYPADVDPGVLARSVSFPCVVKPLALSGSRGVVRVNDAEELRIALGRLRAMLETPEIRAQRDQAHDHILVETFIPGREYAIEGVLNHGVLDVLAVFDKPDPLEGPFFEETIYLTPSRADAALQQALLAAVTSAAAALGLHHGPVHAECRAGEDGIFVLEVAARPIGGLCSRALRFQNQSGADGTVISLEELLLRHALGESTHAWVREPAASGVMMIPIPRRGIFRTVAGTDAARATPCVIDLRITAKPDQVLIPLPEGASYLGFIFARGREPGEVDHALRTAHTQLAFTIDPEVRVLQSPHG